MEESFKVTPVPRVQVVKGRDGKMGREGTCSGYSKGRKRHGVAQRPSS